jgi:hypothetical protein
MLLFLAGLGSPGVAQSARSQQGARSLRPPLAGALALTSSFGEYRANRLHAGVDLSTQGRIGAPVRAVADGVVERVKVTAGGYGRALYLRLDDGRIAVYGHLDRFPPAIAAAVRERQIDARHYRVDWQWDREPLRFAAGDLVGWSGQAGTSAPHLHFEIRDPGNQPLDPIAEGLAVQDRVPPTPLALRFVPRGPGALVAGSPFPFDLPLPDGVVADGEREQVVVAPLELVGEASVEVTVFDRDDAGRGRLAIAGARIVEGGEMRLEMRLDRFSWSNVARSRHLYAGHSEGPGSRTRLRLDVPADGRDEILFAGSARHPYGWIDAPEAETSLLLEFWDRSGNRARVRLRLVPGRSGRVVESAAGDTAAALVAGMASAESEVSTMRSRQPAGSSRVGVRAEPVGSLLALDVRLDPDVAEVPELWWRNEIAADGVAPTRLPSPLRIGPGHWVGWLAVSAPGMLRVRAGGAEWQRSMSYHLAAAGESRIYREEESGASLRIADGGLYRDALVSLAPAELKGSWGALVPQSRAVTVGPAELCFRDRPMLLMPLAAGARGGGAANVQLYRAARSRGKTGWWRVGGNVEVDAGGERSVSGWITRPGTYAAFADTSAPWVGEPVWVESAHCAGIVRIPLSDSGAGVVAESVSLQIDGRWVIAGLDTPRRRIEARLVEALAVGEHRLKIVARDRAGNRVEAERILSRSEL